MQLQQVAVLLQTFWTDETKMNLSKWAASSSVKRGGSQDMGWAHSFLSMMEPMTVAAEWSQQSGELLQTHQEGVFMQQDSDPEDPE